MQRFKSRWVALLTTAVVIAAALTQGLVASAATHTVVTIHNTATTAAENPFIRLHMQKAVYQTGGPFKVKFEYKITDFKRMNAQKQPTFFVNIHSKEVATDPNAFGQFSTAADTNGWKEMKKADGNYITFSNIDPGALIDGAIQPYYLIDMGLFYAKGTVAFRNFRVENAAGTVLYSWDNDTAFTKLFDYAQRQGMSEVNLKDIAAVEPEPVTLYAAFGAGSCKPLLTKEDSGSTASTGTASKSGPVYEDESTKPSSSKAGTTPSTAAPGASTPDGAVYESEPAEGESQPEYEDPQEGDDGYTGEEEQDSSDETSSVGAATENKGGLGAGVIIAIAAVAVLLAGGGVLAWLIISGKLKFSK